MNKSNKELEYRTLVDLHKEGLVYSSMRKVRGAETEKMAADYMDQFCRIVVSRMRPPRRLMNRLSDQRHALTVLALFGLGLGIGIAIGISLT